MPEIFEEHIETTSLSNRSYSRRLNSGTFVLREDQERFEHNHVFFNELGNEIKYMTIHDNLITDRISMNIETHDRIYCAGSRNIVHAGWGNDVIIGSGATARLRYDDLNGNEGHDTIVSKGYALVDGGEGNDTLIGYGRGSFLWGGRGIGNDTLISNGNDNILQGGWGKDTYICNVKNNALNATIEIDSEDRLIVNFKGNNMSFGGITVGERRYQYRPQLFSFINDSSGNNVARVTGELGDFDIRVSNNGSTVTITGQDFFA